MNKHKIFQSCSVLPCIGRAQKARGKIQGGSMGQKRGVHRGNHWYSDLRVPVWDYIGHLRSIACHL